ncbi:MAG: DinB family protein [Planctomycetales bacterium]|nr:DinB family protein [Planctomycetales bacterium]
MSFSGSVIADAGSMAIRYADRLVAGIPQSRFGRMASPGGIVVCSNHPAFVLGHLCLYPERTLTLLGHDPGDAKAPSHYVEYFSKDAKCIDDVDSGLYPPANEIIDFYRKSYTQALDAVRGASDEQLAKENPVDTPMKQVCPTLGSIINFYMTSHVMMHLGQVSVWRRMEGMAAA